MTYTGKALLTYIKAGFNVLQIIEFCLYLHLKDIQAGIIIYIKYV